MPNFMSFLKVFGFEERFFWPRAFGASAVNFCCYQYEPDSSSLPSPFKSAATWKTSSSEFCLKHTGFERISKSTLVTQSLRLLPESVKVWRAKSWIKELPLYLDESPFVDVLFSTDAQSEIKLKTSLAIHSFNQYY